MKAGQGEARETGHRTQAYPRRATTPDTCPRAPLQEAVEATCLGSGRSSKEGGGQEPTPREPLQAHNLDAGHPSWDPRP